MSYSDDSMLYLCSHQWSNAHSDSRSSCSSNGWTLTDRFGDQWTTSTRTRIHLAWFCSGTALSASSKVGQRRHTGSDSFSKVGRGRHPDGDNFSKVGWGRHTSGDVSSKVGRGRHSSGDDFSMVGRERHSSGGISSKVNSQPINLRACRGRHDTSRYSRSATTTSSAERSSSDVICRIKGGVFLRLFLEPVKPVATGISTGSGITSIMSADNLTTPSSFQSVWCVGRRRAGRGIPAVQQVPGLGGRYICSWGVHMRSWVSAGGRVHAGVLVRAVVRSTPPPESGGRSLLLIRGWPSIPDQLPFPALSRSAAMRGEIIA